MAFINMNLTFPIAYWLMPITDLERGLLGHVFNGYNEKHIKPDLRVAIELHSLGEAPFTHHPA